MNSNSTATKYALVSFDRVHTHNTNSKGGVQRGGQSIEFPIFLFAQRVVGETKQARPVRVGVRPGARDWVDHAIIEISGPAGSD